MTKTEKTARTDSDNGAGSNPSTVILFSPKGLRYVNLILSTSVSQRCHEFPTFSSCQGSINRRPPTHSQTEEEGHQRHQVTKPSMGSRVSVSSDTPTSLLEQGTGGRWGLRAPSARPLPGRDKRRWWPQEEHLSSYHSRAKSPCRRTGWLQDHPKKSSNPCVHQVLSVAE